jgi:tetratricopeptide (TPR) repeat protein
MKFKLVKIIPLVMSGILLSFSISVYGDQSDARLSELFITLQNSQNDTELQEAETMIWEIWHQSGEEEIDHLMAEAAKATGKGELEIAESLYTQVVQKAPEFSEGWNRRATVRFYKNDYDSSLEDIKRTLILEPRHFGAFWGLGMILGSKLEYSKAIAAFERLLELKPNARDAKPRIEMLKKEIAKSAV